MGRPGTWPLAVLGLAACTAGSQDRNRNSGVGKSVRRQFLPSRSGDHSPRPTCRGVTLRAAAVMILSGYWRPNTGNQMARSSANRPADRCWELIADVIYHGSEWGHTEDTAFGDSILLSEGTGEMVSYANPKVAMGEEILDKHSHTATYACVCIVCVCVLRPSIYFMCIGLALNFCGMHGDRRREGPPASRARAKVGRLTPTDRYPRDSNPGPLDLTYLKSF